MTALFKGDHMQCLFRLLEKREYETYLESLIELRDGLYRKYNITLGYLTFILDFELAIQQAFTQAHWKSGIESRIQ